MADMGDFYNDVKAWRKERREKLGVPCPMCNVKQPKRTPTILLPGQQCRVDGYRDPRPDDREQGKAEGEQEARG